MITYLYTIKDKVAVTHSNVFEAVNQRVMLRQLETLVKNNPNMDLNDFEVKIIAQLNKHQEFAEETEEGAQGELVKEEIELLVNEPPTILNLEPLIAKMNQESR